MNNLLYSPRTRGTNQYQEKYHWKTKRELICYMAAVYLLLLGAGLNVTRQDKKAEAATLISPIATSSAAIKSAPTKADIIAKAKHADIISRIHYLESSEGKATRGYHKGCEAKGQSNEFGYGVWLHVCFNSFEEAVNRVDVWFEKELKTYSLAQSLCLYNIGETVSDCQYARDFMKK